MAVTFVGVGAETIQNTTIPIPSGSNGDLLLLCWESDTSTDVATATGWTASSPASTTFGAGGHVFGYLWRIRTGSEGASVTLSGLTTTPWTDCFCVVYSGVDQTTPINAAGIDHDTLTVSSITTTVDGCMEFVGITADLGYGAGQTMSGWTRRLDGSANNDCAFERAQATGGATGTSTIPSPGDTRTGIVHVAIAPPVAIAASNSRPVPLLGPGSQGPLAWQWRQRFGVDPTPVVAAPGATPAALVFGAGPADLTVGAYNPNQILFRNPDQVSIVGSVPTFVVIGERPADLRSGAYTPNQVIFRNPDMASIVASVPVVVVQGARTNALDLSTWGAYAPNQVVSRNPDRVSIVGSVPTQIVVQGQRITDFNISVSNQWITRNPDMVSIVGSVPTIIVQGNRRFVDIQPFYPGPFFSRSSLVDITAAAPPAIVLGARLADLTVQAYTPNQVLFRNPDMASIVASVPTRIVVRGAEVAGVTPFYPGPILSRGSLADTVIVTATAPSAVVFGARITDLSVQAYAPNLLITRNPDRVSVVGSAPVVVVRGAEVPGLVAQYPNTILARNPDRVSIVGSVPTVIVQGARYVDLTPFYPGAILSRGSPDAVPIFLVPVHSVVLSAHPNGLVVVSYQTTGVTTARMSAVTSGSCEVHGAVGQSIVLSAEIDTDPETGMAI